MSLPLADPAKRIQHLARLYCNVISRPKVGKVHELRIQFDKLNILYTEAPMVR
jgi:hypothetical protein